MTDVFGVPIVRVMYGVLVLLSMSVVVLAWIAWRHPVLLRMGLRNIWRRPAQTTLIVFGLMLSTLIMSAAFATGDTVSYSVAAAIYDGLQETDLTLAFDPSRATGDGAQALRDSDLDATRALVEGDRDIDGVTGSIEVPTAVILRAKRLSEPRARLVGLEPGSAARFKWTRDGDTVVDVAALGSGDAYVTRSLASSVDARVGDVVTIFLDGAPHDFRVARVIEDFGVTGLGPTPGGAKLVTTIEVARTIASRGDQLSTIAVSFEGGVRDPVERAEPIERAFASRLESSGIPARVEIYKRVLVNLANLAGSVAASFFVLFGLFSISAGVLLIFLIFVMLAAERRAEMGIARAVGMQRLHVTEAFIAEGMTYNVGAAAVGAGLGIGVAYGLYLALRSIFAGEAGLAISFNFNPVGSVIAYGLGVVLTFVTVAYASWRASSLNIVRAIRDLPEPDPFGTGGPSVLGLLRAAAAALVTVAWTGLAALWATAAISLFILSLPFYGIGVLLGLPLAAWFAVAIAAARRPFERTRGWRRAAYLGWWISFFPLSLVTWALVLLNDWARRHSNGGGWGLVLLAAGLGATYVGGWVWGQAFAYESGHTLALLGVAMLAVYFRAPARPAFTLAGLLAVWYWLLPLPFSLLFEGGSGWRDPLRGVLAAVGGPVPLPIAASVEMFFVAGICITAASTLVVVFNASRFLSVISVLGWVSGSLTPAARTAVAYPLAARFRTGMTVAMFGLVVFSLVVVASVADNIGQLFLGEEAAAGFDVGVQVSADNPIGDLRAELGTSDPAALVDIEAVARLVLTRAEAAEPADGGNFQPVAVTGVDDEFLRNAPLSMLTRARGYESDRAVMEALRADPSTAIIHPSYVGQRGGPGPRGRGPGRFALAKSEPELIASPWDPIVVAIRNRETGAVREVRVIGVIGPRQGALIQELGAVVTAESGLRGVFPEATGGTILLRTRGGERTALDVARRVESALFERGAQAESLHELIREASRQWLSFQLLFEGFMALGLVVGIAALGVIAFRTVVERRQQIGMLRAIGYTRRLVALSFFLESSFIAATGIGMGIVLGVALSYNLLSSPDFTGGADIVFNVPWLRLLLIGGVAYGASALMTLLPARAASRVPVAAALRYE